MVEVTKLCSVTIIEQPAKLASQTLNYAVICPSKNIDYPKSILKDNDTILNPNFHLCLCFN